MKKSFNKVIATLIFCYVIGCVSYKDQLLTGIGDVEQARKNVITDFVNTYKTPRNYLKERKGRPFDVFWVFKKESKNNLWIFSVSPETDGYVSLGIKDSLGKVPESYFPNNFEVRKGKLFIWKDSFVPLQGDILDVLEDFGVLDSIDVKRELRLLPEDFEDTRVLTLDHELESSHYFVCKSDIEKYIKVYTNKALGSYEPKKLNCTIH